MSLTNFKVTQMEKNFWLIQPTRFGPVNVVCLVSHFLLLCSWSFLFPFNSCLQIDKTDRILGKFTDEEENVEEQVEEDARSISWNPTVCSCFNTLRSIPLPLQSLFFFNSFAYVDEMKPCGTHWDWTFFFFLLYIEIKIGED